MSITTKRVVGMHGVDASFHTPFIFILQVCDICVGPHPTHKCQVGSASRTTVEFEKVNYVNRQGRLQNNPYSNIYNLGWRSHPSFS